ncbi:thrombospondin type 3 repeat-containing protein, partial [Pseudomonadales bacterium]|nr:thrombospondin type 3 repeat-containing protein [Pseudomonadales bacterium]
HLSGWSGELITADMVQINTQATLLRPEAGLGGTWDNQCTAFTADQVFKNLNPSGGLWMSFLYEANNASSPPSAKDGNSFLICSNTTPGTYQLSIEALDGRGGKVKADFTLVITDENLDAGAIYWGESPPEGYFLHETFDTDAADTQTLLDTYSLWSQIGVAPLEVDQNRLVGSQAGSWVLSGLRLNQLIPLSAHISVDIGRANSGGDHSVGVRLGDLNFSFAPGLDVSGIKGHFRVETWEGDEKIIRGVNQDMGFLPNVNVMHKFEATVSQADASASIVIIDGENSANRYEYFVTHPSLGRPYQLALTNHGHIGTGHVYHDNVIVSLINDLIDSDGDGVPDNTDVFPNDPAASVDTDGDGMPDDWNPGQSASDSTSQPPLELDNDDDNDGYDDSVDVFPLDPSEWADCEGDGIGDNADTDDDNDGIPDAQDTFPCNPAYSQDSDGDGIPDTWELQYGLDPLDPRDAYFDLDQDGYLNWEEYQMGLDPSVSDREAQLIYVQAAAYIVPGSSARLTVNYSTTDTNPNLSGLGIRVHYDARYVSSVELTNIFSESFISVSAPQEDVNDFDGDPQTDRYILVSWASIQGPIWPGSLPAELFDIEIESVEGISCLPYYPIRFSVSAAATGYNVSAPSVYNPVMQATLDVDGDGEAAALTDGLLIIRRLFGFSGSTLINGSVAQSAEYQSAPAIADRIDGFNGAFDIDADGKTEALTDGLLIIRRLFGFSGTTLVAGSVASDGARTDATAIARYIDALSSADTNGGSCPSLPDGMIDSNDGTYLTDLNSGLDWRDVNLTLGLSFNEVSTKILSGDLIGWRFATIPEINTLISNFSGIEFDVTTYGGIELENNEIDELITLLGPTSIQGSERIVWGFHSTGPSGNSTRSAWLRDVGVEGLTDTTVANNGLTDKSLGLADHGSFLVRETQL